MLSFSFFYFTINFMNFIFCLMHPLIILIFIRSKLWPSDRWNSFSLGWSMKSLLTITDLHPQFACLLEVWGCSWSWICGFRVESLLLLEIYRWFLHDIAINCFVSNQLFYVNFLDLYITDRDLVTHAIIKWWTRPLFAFVLIIFPRRFHFTRIL